MRKPLAIVAATAAVVLSLGLAACGSDSSTSADEDVLTNQELITQADKICTDFNNELATKAQKSGLSDKSPKSKITAFVSDEIVPMYRDEIDELRALEPNSEDADAYAKMIDTLESELDAVEQDPEAAVASNTPFPEASKLADEFGLQVCGG